MIQARGLYDIYGMSGIPVWQTTWFTIVFVLLLLSVLIVGIYCGIRKWQRRKKQERSYWEKAYNELNQLQKHMAYAQDKKLFYTALTRILKSYLSDYYQEAYWSKTDQEVGARLSRSGIVLPPKEHITTLFYQVTPIKFARSCDTQTTMTQDINRAMLFIKKTAPSSSTR